MAMYANLLPSGNPVTVIDFCALLLRVIFSIDGVPWPYQIPNYQSDIIDPVEVSIPTTEPAVAFRGTGFLDLIYVISPPMNGPYLLD